MRKKSHILLARYLADQMQTTASLQSHRKAFCLGSILPDIKPSFITRRHEFYGTFEDVKNRMKELADIRPDESNQRVYWRRFGEVIHYMADYFNTAQYSINRNPYEFGMGNPPKADQQYLPLAYIIFYFLCNYF